MTKQSELSRDSMLLELSKRTQKARDAVFSVIDPSTPLDAVLLMVEAEELAQEHLPERTSATENQKNLSLSQIFNQRIESTLEKLRQLKQQSKSQSSKEPDAPDKQSSP